MGTLQFETLKQRQITDEVYNLLREKIIAWELSPGQRIAVDEIAGQLGVSRTPLKDALSKLESEGLIEIRPRRGTFVTQLTPDDVRETFEVREALEIKACELLEGKLDDARIAELRAVNEKFTGPGISLAENARLDAHFHFLLVKFCGNTHLLDIYSRLNAHLQIARIHYQSDHWMHRLRIAREEHAAIVDAFADNRTDVATALLREHIRSSMRRMISDMPAANGDVDLPK